jgi:class 3 adenylate cyclase/predicted ATPase
MADDIAQWLEGLGLGRHAQTFADNGIDIDILSSLTEDDFRELGLNLGDRRRVQRALQPESPGPKETAGSEPTNEQIASVSDAERRQLTVLFCDLVGSTALATRLDPEDMRDVLRAYQEACAGVIARYDGYVAKFMGDGVYAYFGYPRAHEDDAERAINAGLGIVDAVGALGRDLHVRIGVATGTVAVGDIVGTGASEEANVIGEAPNLAARLQEIASPDTVVIGEATYSLTGTLFEISDLGHHDFKGFVEPIRAWAVARARRVESRFEATRGEHLTPLVGREEEIEILLRRWQRAKASEGQVVLISGEPGIGKSRLMRELDLRVGTEAEHRLRFQCSPYHTNSALHPVIEHLEGAAKLSLGDTTEIKLDKIEALLADSAGMAAGAPALIASLLSVPTAGRYPEITVTPQRQKDLTLRVLCDRLVDLASHGPVLFMFEDAHWIDPTTLELLDLTVDRVADAPVLVVITCRQEFASPWTGRPHVTLQPLNRLRSADCGAMAEGVIAGKALPEAVRAQIVEKTDGVPLFVEELTKSLLDTGVLGEENERIVLRGDLTTMSVPATLQDSLEARLDRLPSVREVAQIGSVIGREFPYGLMAEVAPLKAEDLLDALARLVQSELVFSRGEPPEATYTFKHALVQDTAYASLMRGRRQELHGRVASVLESRAGNGQEAEPEMLAHHFGEAGNTDKAIYYWHQAGKRATERSANWEAVAHIDRARGLLAAVPESRDRDELELEILVDLTGPLIASKGYVASDAELAPVRALELCHRIGETPKIYPVLFARYSYFLALSQPIRALEFAEDFLRRADQEGDETLRMMGHRLAGSCTFFAGRLTEAREHLDQVLALHEEERHRSLGRYYGHDPKVTGLSMKAVCLWVLGFPDSARECIQEAREFARATAHPNSTCYALSFLGVVQDMLRDSDGLAECTRAIAIESEEFVIPFWAHYAEFFSALSDFEAGNPDESIRIMIAGFDSIPAETWQPLWHYLATRLADALRRTGRTQEGLAWLDKAQAVTDFGGERWSEPEIWRIRGELMLNAASQEGTKAEESYQRAIEIAQTQCAKSWELRAATGLARLWQLQGKTTEARELLAPLYGWFTEGFDTADLTEAKTLLEELS